MLAFAAEAGAFAALGGQVLRVRLAAVQRRLAAGRVSVVRGGRGLLARRANLAAAGLTQDRWREQWQAARLFLTADGEKDKAFGNETIRWHPGQGWVEVKLPVPLAGLANRPHGRYRLSCPVAFAYRGDEVAAQAAAGAVRYDVSCDPERGRWYLDASWRTAPAPAAPLEELRRHPVVAVDLNAGHLAVAVLARDANPAGAPAMIPLDLAGLPASQRDGRLRAAISALIGTGRRHGARRSSSRIWTSQTPGPRAANGPGTSPAAAAAAGPGGRWSPVSRPAGSGTGSPKMASNAGLAVIAVDPA